MKKKQIKIAISEELLSKLENYGKTSGLYKKSIVISYLCEYALKELQNKENDNEYK